jgi:hypothetical protein
MMLDGQDPFQICGVLCQTRKTPTLVRAIRGVRGIRKLP